MSVSVNPLTTVAASQTHGHPLAGFHQDRFVAILEPLAVRRGAAPSAGRTAVRSADQQVPDGERRSRYRTTTFIAALLQPEHSPGIRFSGSDDYHGTIESLKKGVPPSRKCRMELSSKSLTTLPLVSRVTAALHVKAEALHSQQ